MVLVKPVTPLINSVEEIILENQKTWDIVAPEFFNASALPVWGPFGIGDDLGLISEIKNKTFLEIACGSGRSIKYLVDNGAKKVYGLDFSNTQIEEARRFNIEAVTNGTVELICGPMENTLNIEPVDMVFSVYGIGWTQDPAQTLSNIYSYLKPGGQFIWSWDHAFFNDVIYEEGKFIIKGSYHDEKPIVIPNWKKRPGVNACLTYRKTATWFKLLKEAGFTIVNYHEPKPKNGDWGAKELTRYYTLEKASKVPCSFIFVCQKPV